MRVRSLALAVWAFLAALPAYAEVARVNGGEHDDFTRLVVEGPIAGEWALGRTEDGYELGLPASVTSFDLTRAFEKIPRNRLAALWQDPQTGRLRFSLACACHAFAFEFRPDIVVIDIRSGPAPAESAFEAPLAPAGAETEPAETTATPESGYDWIALQREAENAVSVAIPGLELPTGDVSLDPLQDALLSEISKGVAEGVVDLAEGGLAEGETAKGTDEAPWMRIAIGELPGLAVSDDRQPGSGLTPDGRACIGDDQLDVAGWGSEGPPATQLGLARSGMLTEFDAPDETAVLRSARYHVFLGFGAEARQILSLVPDQSGDDVRRLLSMAAIVDEQLPKENPFEGMESCESAAALWAVLASRPSAGLPSSTNRSAVSRSFSALPGHLRQHLAGSLVDKFLADGDQETARRLRDAALRVAEADDAEVALMDARYQLAKGEEGEARELAEEVLSDRGPETAEAAATLVEAAFKGDRIIDPGLPSVIEALLTDAAGKVEREDLERAAVLAHAMVGNYSDALRIGSNDPDTFSDLSEIVSSSADDNALLEFAARAEPIRPKTRPDVETAMAERLLGLGMADMALQWLSPVSGEDPAERRIVAGQAYVLLRDPVPALAILEGLEGTEAEQLRARARLQLGETRAAAEDLARAGDKDAAARAIVWSQDWAFVAEAGPADWQEVISELDLNPDETSPGPDAPGPIAEGTTLVEKSAEVRTAIENLLAETTSDEPSQ